MAFDYAIPIQESKVIMATRLWERDEISRKQLQNIVQHHRFPGGNGYFDRGKGLREEGRVIIWCVGSGGGSHLVQVL